MGTFAIMGITGQVGGAAARNLLEQGHKIRAVVRSRAAAARWQALGADTALASLDDKAALTTAFDQVDGIFVMTPPWFASGDMFAENALAVAALRQALGAVQPTKVVMLSSIGAQHAHGTGAIGKMNVMEHALGDLPMVTAIRAGWFMENYRGLLSTVPQSGYFDSMLAPLDLLVPMVAARDVGDAVAQLLCEPWQDQRVIELEGPQRYTPRKVADAMALATSRPVEARELPRAAWHTTFSSWGLTPHAASAMVDMVDGFNSGHIAFTIPQAATRHGTTTLETVLTQLSSIQA